MTMMIGNIFTKYGIAIVLSVIVGLLLLSVINGSRGIATMISDIYLPKQYIIVEKYPFRIIYYGQIYKDRTDDNETSTADNIIKITKILGAMPAYNGKLNEKIDINVNSNLNTKQIRNGRDVSDILKEY